MQEVYAGGEGGKRPSERRHERQEDRETGRQRINERLFVYFIFDLTSKEENESW